MNNEQFRKIKPKRTLYSAEIIDSSEPEYFLDYKITTVRYLPTDEHYDIVREMFKICDNDPDNVVNWYNEKLVKILEHDLKILDENNADKDSIRYERIQKCRDDTLHFLVKRGRVIPQNILTEKQPEKESGGGSEKFTGDWTDTKIELVKDLRGDKENGIYKTYAESYRHAEKYITVNGEPVKAERLKSLYYKTQSVNINLS
jgi:hypothetical protein